MVKNEIKFFLTKRPKIHSFEGIVNFYMSFEVRVLPSISLQL